MNPFVKFMVSSAGRSTRVVVGGILVAVGLLLMNGLQGAVWGIVVAVIGLVPLLAGTFDKCVFAPLFGVPFDGSKAREGGN